MRRNKIVLCSQCASRRLSVGSWPWTAPRPRAAGYGATRVAAVAQREKNARSGARITAEGQDQRTVSWLTSR